MVVTEYIALDEEYNLSLCQPPESMCFKEISTEFNYAVTLFIDLPLLR